MNTALSLFESECSELLDKLEGQLLACENHALTQSDLDEMFREAHTIKGNAAVAQAGEVEWFAHVIESVFSRVRDGNLKVDSPLVEVLLPCIDHLRFLVKLCVLPGKTSQEFADGERAQLIGRLVPYLDEGEEISIPEHSSNIDPNCWHIHVHFSPDVFRQGLDPVYFFQHLQTLGRLSVLQTSVGDLPAVSEYQPEHCYLSFKLALDTTADKQTIEDAFALIRDACTLRITPPLNKTQDFMELIHSLPVEDLHLGEMLVRIGALTAEELTNALRDQRLTEQIPRSEREIGKILVAQGYVEAELVDAVLRRQSEIRLALAQEHRLLRVSVDEMAELEERMSFILHNLERMAQESVGQQDSLIARQVPALVAQVKYTVEMVQALQRIRLDDIFSRLHRIIHDTARKLNKQVDLLLSGGELEIDRVLGEKLLNPLVHLIRNALDHGIEPAAERLAAGKNARGQIRLDAWTDAHGLCLQFADDGAGIDRDRVRRSAIAKGLMDKGSQIEDSALLAFLFTPGFSTSAQVTPISGRGVGLDVVKRAIEALGGSISLRSLPARGTRFEIHLPFAHAAALEESPLPYKRRY